MGSLRGDSATPNGPVPRSTHSTGGYNYGYRGGYGYNYPTRYPYYSYGPYSWSIGFSIGYGGFSIGLGWPYVQYGPHSVAILAGGAWHIQPYYYGWYGYRYGSHCYYWPRWRHHHHHWFHYDGWYCRVNRPYWYGYSRWYDWRPYGYGYYSLSYDSLYDDGYDDGYNRGYEDGAEDSSAYRDDRRRDRIGEAPKAEVPDPEKDRERGNAAQEFRYEMGRGSEAFNNGDYETSTKAFKEAVILDPGSAEARYSLSVSAFAQGKYAFSAFALRRALVLDPKGSNIDLVKAFGGPEVLKGYVEHLESELKIAPEDPDLLLLHGFAKLRTGDARTAAESLDKARARLPQDKATGILHEEAINALDE